MIMHGQIFNVFTSEEISKLHSSFRGVSNQKNNQEFDHRHYTYLAGFTQRSVVFPFLKKIIFKIEQHLNRKLVLHVGKLMVQNDPLPIHTDYVKGDKNPDLAILIPLNLSPIKTSTIVFEQQCLNNFETFKNDNKKLAKNASELHNTSCSHVSKNDLEYVSLLSSYEWIPLSVIYWDRKLLHCSDNFVSNLLIDKTAMVLLTTND